MVGHTGKFDAAVKAIEAIDSALGRVVAAVRQAGGEMLVTADHGNAELMLNDETSQPHTAHTTNLVPLLYIGRPAHMTGNGALSDIAPSLLYIMNMEIPPEMTGTPLIEWLSSGEEDEPPAADLELHG
jgi:2,3-bisphosphoglycerate-independent phosphoglycerate mutase